MALNNQAMLHLNNVRISSPATIKEITGSTTKVVSFSVVVEQAQRQMVAGTVQTVRIPFFYPVSVFGIYGERLFNSGAFRVGSTISVHGDLNITKYTAGPTAKNAGEEVISAQLTAQYVVLGQDPAFTIWQWEVAQTPEGETPPTLDQIREAHAQVAAANKSRYQNAAPRLVNRPQRTASPQQAPSQPVGEIDLGALGETEETVFQDASMEEAGEPALP